MKNYCQNCHWYTELPGPIKCLYTERKNWKPSEDLNTCNDFITTQDYVPEPMWIDLVSAVDTEMRKREK